MQSESVWHRFVGLQITSQSPGTGGIQHSSQLAEKIVAAWALILKDGKRKANRDRMVERGRIEKAMAVKQELRAAG